MPLTLGPLGAKIVILEPSALRVDLQRALDALLEHSAQVLRCPHVANAHLEHSAHLECLFALTALPGMIRTAAAQGST